jgi:DNA-binding protein HU-beta
MYLIGSKLILIFVNMNKKDLIDEVASKTDLTKKEIDTVLTSILEIITSRVSEGDRVRLVGFGSFYKSRKKLNLYCEEDNIASEICLPKFSPGKFFKEKVNVQK